MSFAMFHTEMNWSRSEKQAARRVFDKAFSAQCLAITEEAKRMIANITQPSDIWRVHDYLSEHRSAVGRTYDYRYSKLLSVFSLLLAEGWLTESDLADFHQTKVERIKAGAAFIARRDRPQVLDQSGR